MSNRILLKFNEPATAIFPSDREGNVEDFQGDGGAHPKLELPEVVDGLTGFARRFTEDDGAQADDIDSAALLERDMSIQCLIDIDVSAQFAHGAPGIVAACAAAWQWQIEILDVATRLATMRLGWVAVSQADPDIAGAAGQPFLIPVDGYLMLTVTRRWVDSGEVRVRYYGNETLLGEVTSAFGDVDGAAADPVTLGCRPNGANYEYWLEADVDGILVTDHEMSLEEIRQTYRRIAIHQPQGRQILQPLLAAGDAYSTDPDSVLQKEIAVEGDALGMVFSAQEQLREDWITTRCWSMLPDWERVCRLPPKLLDSLEVRRDRITSYLRKVHKHNHEGVKTALSAVLDLPAEDLEIVEYDNHYSDDFSGGAADPFADFFLAHDPTGHIVHSAGDAQFNLANAADARWQTRNDTKGPLMLRMSIDGDPPRPSCSGSGPSLGCDLQVEVSSGTANFGVDNYFGLFAYNLAGDLLFYGWRNNAAVFQRGWRRYTTAGGWGAWTSIATPNSPPGYIRMRFDGDFDWVLFYHAADPDDVSAATSITGIAIPTNMGIAFFCSAASNPGATSMEADNFRAFVPNGQRSYYWYVYRDPALPGVADLPGARAVLNQLKPAHTYGSCIDREYCECDDPGSGCDTGGGCK